MRRFVPVLLCLILLMGGLCSGFCLAQTTTGDSAHSCCHGKNHCGHAAPSMQAHTAVAVFQPVPVIPAQPIVFAPEQQDKFSAIDDIWEQAELFVPPSLIVLRL